MYQTIGKYHQRHSSGFAILPENRGPCSCQLWSSWQSLVQAVRTPGHPDHSEGSVQGPRAHTSSSTWSTCTSRYCTSNCDGYLVLCTWRIYTWCTRCLWETPSSCSPVATKTTCSASSRYTSRYTLHYSIDQTWLNPFPAPDRQPWVPDLRGVREGSSQVLGVPGHYCY